MPNRILREGILSSERVDQIAADPAVEVTYRRLYSVADDYGRFSAHPSLVRAALYPLRLDQYTDADILHHLRKCANAGLVLLYEVDRKPYLEVLDFRQKTRAKRSKYPSPDGQMPSACGTDDQHMHTESESRVESRESETDTETLDLDCALTNRKNRDTSAHDNVPHQSKAKQYPLLRKALCEYFQEPGQEKLQPSDRLVVDVVAAAGGSTEREIVDCLAYLYRDRGLKPGTRNGPRHWSWFPTVVKDYFDQKRQREDVANPVGFHEWQDRNEYRLSKERFDEMTDGIELPDGD